MARQTKKEVIKRKNLIRKLLEKDEKMTTAEMLRRFEDKGISTTHETLGKYRKQVEEDMLKNCSGRLEDMREYRDLMKTLNKLKKARDKIKRQWDNSKTDTGRSSLGRLYKDALKDISNLKKEILEIKLAAKEQTRPIYKVKIGDFPEAKKKEK